ncbi:Aste57867_20311 [Aphanomyces stellatus]|uniref:Aste57867_20311 protein n=1 Tax=Aphanomyces stellatus TaxID=120398 RepID=A0A485KJ74_9STRA|nr:hypothetical protein As57867_020245 [Aphanomyces stellatus]KAF0701526.1 hypothetical protein As57867_007993 [Aphanomyces stellatus]VFT84916.1 Aste57867_8023 [Aphanomyces stellatus]VFT97000.1 Aste57867_20311 [Aphanomyces stellatus]
MDKVSVWHGSYEMAILTSTRDVRAWLSCEVEVCEVHKPIYTLVFHVTSDNRDKFARNITTKDVAECVKNSLSNPNQFVSKSSAGIRSNEAITLWTTRRKTPAREDIIIWLLEHMVLIEQEGRDRNRFQVALMNEIGITNAEFKNKLKPSLTSASSDKASVRGSSHVDRLFAEEMPIFAAPVQEDNSDSEEELPGFSPKKHIAVLSQEFKEHQLACSDEDFEREDSLDAQNPNLAESAPSYRTPRQTQDQNSWSNDSWRLVLELKKSKQDIEKAQEQKRKQALVFKARKQQLLASASKLRTQSKFEKQTKKLVKEATNDAIEYHKVLTTVEKQAKKEYVKNLRDHEQTTRFLRTGQRQTWRKGAYLGPGPHPTSVYVEAPFENPFIYDVHGRKHDLNSSGEVFSQSLFDAAMKKIQREATKAGKHLFAYFKHYDADRSGTLEYEEFYRALLDISKNLTPDQAQELFRYFDCNHTGAIDYGEVC